MRISGPVLFLGSAPPARGKHPNPAALIATCAPAGLARRMRGPSAAPRGAGPSPGTCRDASHATRVPGVVAQRCRRIGYLLPCRADPGWFTLSAWPSRAVPLGRGEARPGSLLLSARAFVMASSAACR